jgi:4-hydroxythreonine-4-phosphate dehydrogenase
MGWIREALNGKRHPSMKPIVGITMGDAAGVGPEVIAKALSHKELYDVCRPLVVGDASVMKNAVAIAKQNLKIESVGDPAQGRYQYGTIDVLDLHNVDMSRLEFGKVQAMAGKASLEYIETGAKLATQNRIHALCTASINKEAIRKAGAQFPGHTEILANLTNTKEVTMLLIAGNIRVFHVTIHEPLGKVPLLITKESVLETIRLAYNSLRGLGIADPKIAVAGLNPHASDGGLFGSEEKEKIAPAVEAANKAGIRAFGPIPPDTVFVRANKGEFDGVVAMYHDQGHIPVKLLAFESGVNVTIGLPIIRTSVDHGTAYDIAGKGIADEKSMVEAIKLAAKMAEVKMSSKP